MVDEGQLFIGLQSVYVLIKIAPLGREPFFNPI